MIDGEIASNKGEQLTIRTLIQHLLTFEDLDTEIWIYGHDDKGNKMLGYFTVNDIEMSAFHYLGGQTSDVLKINARWDSEN